MQKCVNLKRRMWKIIAAEDIVMRNLCKLSIIILKWVAEIWRSKELCEFNVRWLVVCYSYKSCQAHYQGEISKRPWVDGYCLFWFILSSNCPTVMPETRISCHRSGLEEFYLYTKILNIFLKIFKELPKREETKITFDWLFACQCGSQPIGSNYGRTLTILSMKI